MVDKTNCWWVLQRIRPRVVRPRAATAAVVRPRPATTGIVIPPRPRPARAAAIVATLACATGGGVIGGAALLPAPLAVHAPAPERPAAVLPGDRYATGGVSAIPTTSAPPTSVPGPSALLVMLPALLALAAIKRGRKR